MKPFQRFLVFVILSAGVILLMLNRNIPFQQGHHRYQIWADKAGYNIYLPATFIYKFDGAKLPNGIVDQTGRGFKVSGQKIITKYPYGTALLQMPLWFVANSIAEKQDGFSWPYAMAINFTSVLLTLSGFIFIYLILRRKDLSEHYIIVFLGFSFFTTGLLYYTVQDSGMSHASSFFVSCLLFYLADHPEIHQRKKLVYLLAIFFGFMGVIRFINLAFLLMYFLSKAAHRSLLQKHWIKILAAILLFQIPQWIYNYYAFHSPWVDSYEGEQFIYLMHPKWIPMLFSPHNGMLLYHPILIIIISASFIDKNSRLGLIGLFVLYLVVYGTWHSWYLGCGLGHRGFNDFLPFFLVPAAIIIYKSSLKKILFWGSIGCTLYNFMMLYSFAGCYYGQGDWDWNAYLETAGYLIKKHFL